MTRLLFLLTALLAAPLVPAFAQSGPSNVSVTPATGPPLGSSGASQIFSFTASSPNGYGYISWMQMIFNYGVDGTSACFLFYQPSSNSMDLYSNYGPSEAGGGYVVPGAGTLSNSQCTVNLAASSVSGSGNALTVNVAISFQAGFLGPQNVYLETGDNGGLYSYWQQMGTWTAYPATSAQPPTVMGVAPSSGTGLSQLFTYTINDLNGYGYVPVFDVLFNTSLNTVNACHLQYSQTANLFVLFDNTGTVPSTAVPEAQTVLRNSQCTLYAAQSAVLSSVNHPNDLVVSFALTFASSFAGLQTNYVNAVDHTGQSSGWQAPGNWTVALSSLPPSNGTVTTPPSGSQTFSFTGSSPNGFGYISWMQAIFNYGVQGDSACYVFYSQSSNTLDLYSDYGPSEAGSGTVGAAGMLSNSQCTVDLSKSSVSGSLDTLTLNVSITFQPSFLGQQNIYLATGDNSGQYANWQQVGTWIAYAVTYPQAIPTGAVTPPSGMGLSQPFTYTIQDQNGYGYIPVFDVLFSTSLNTVNACHLQYSQAANLFVLFDNTGTVPSTAAPGAGVTLANSQCSLNAAQSTVSKSGNNLVVSFALAFTQTVNFTGPQNNYVNAVDHAGNSNGWQSSWTWTVAPADFTLSLSAPNPATVIAGGSTAYTVTVAPAGGAGFTGNVTLAAVGLPAGAKATFSPATISGGSGTSTMTVTSPVGLTASVAGTSVSASGTLSHTATAAGALAVQDFTLAASPSSSSSSPLIVTAGQAVTFTVSAAGSNNYATPVNLSLSVPLLQTCNTCIGETLTEGSVTPGGGSVNFTWFVPYNTWGGTYSYSIGGSSPGLSHSVTGQVSVAAQDFNVSLVQTPIQTVSSPGSATFTISLTSINNFAGTVGFCCLPYSTWIPVTGGNLGYFPSVTLTAGQTTTAPFTINFPSGFSGQQQFAMLASGGSVNHNVTAAVAFGSSPGSVLSVSSTHSGSFPVGQPGAYTITVTNQSGGGPTGGTVTVTDTIPAGLTLVSMSGTGWACSGNTCTRSDALAGGASYAPISVLVNVGLNAPAQVYNQVSVSGGGAPAANGVDTTAIQGSSSPPDFTLTPTQNPQTVAPGGSATYTLSVSPKGSFGNTAVSLSMGAIAGASASVSPSATAAAPATLTVTSYPTTSFGTIPILITGISGDTTHYAVANLTVAPVAPAAIMTPPPGQFIPGGTTVFTWNSGNGASQYRLTAGSTPGGADYYSGATSSSLSASVSLPSTAGQPAYVTLTSYTPAGAALPPQTYAYTISTQGISSGLQMVSGGPMAYVNNNGVEVAYTYRFTGGDARALTACVPLEDVVTLRLIQQTASTATIGFTSKPGTPVAAFDFSCQCPGGGHGGPGNTPVIYSITPNSIQANVAASIQIAGMYFGDPSDGADDGVDFCPRSGGQCTSVDATPASDSLIVAGVTLSADPNGYSVTVITEAGESNQGSLGVSAPAPPIYDTPPSISYLAPADIPALSGQLVEIHGTNLGSAGNLTICQGGNCLPYTIPSASWTDMEVDVVVDASSATAGASYTVTLSTTTDYLGNSYLAAPGSPADSTSSSLEIDPVPAVTPAEILITTSSTGIGDCYWPNGAGYWVGYVRVMTYQVVGPGPAHQTFFGSAVPTIRETVTTTSSGNKIVGGGVWQRSDNSITANGVFTDFLTSNGNRADGGGPITANQSFAATGGTGNLIVNIQGMQFSILANSYSPALVNIASTTSPRACVSGDPN